MLTCSAFINGINYWPARKAMYWWDNFDSEEVEKDFLLMSTWGFQVIRIFLNWETFQPQPDTVNPAALVHLQQVADVARKNYLFLMPTFFCGHMSGVNWMPAWMLDSSKEVGRFPVYSQGRLQALGIKNYYLEPDLIRAQQFQIEKVTSALKGHPAIMAYDLGNENSNCLFPPERKLACHWLSIMTREINKNSPGTPVTLGMHAEDLEEDRKLWPQDAAQYCDFLSIHAYPFYLSWVEDPLDTSLVPFIGELTCWLGEKEVLLQEFGAPTLPKIGLLPKDYKQKLKCPIWSEREIRRYFKQTLAKLRQTGMLGALAWCFADYHPDLWSLPPLNDNCHERHFGLFAHNHQSKKQCQAFVSDSLWPGNSETCSTSELWTWTHGCKREDFYLDPINNLKNLFQRYKEVNHEP